MKPCPSSPLPAPRAAPTAAPSPRAPLALAAALALGMTTAALWPGAAAFAQVTQAAAATAATPPDASRFRGEPVTLNFVNADIEGVSRAMSAILKQQFLVDPRVKGAITLYSEQPLSPREAYINFLAALRGLGFTVVEVGGLFKIVPEADAKLQTGQVSIGDVSRRGDQVITQIFRLNFESANNLVPVLRPLISPNNSINANPGNNSLVITDYADNLQRIAKIVAAMDTPATSDVEVIPLQYAVAADIAALVQRLADAAGASPGVPGAAAAQGSSVLVDARSNSLLVRAANPARVANIRSLVAKLDRPTSGSNQMGNVWVIYLKNADAVRLAAVLRAAFSQGGGSGGASGGSATGGGSSLGGSGGTGQFGGSTNTSTSTGGSLGSSGASTQSTSPVNAAAGPSTGGFIQADPATNSLIVTAPEPLYRQLRAVVDQLDSRRAQVYIESLIVEVDATKAADLGVQWQGILGNAGDKNIIGLGTNFGTGTDNILSASQIAAGGLSTIAGADLPSNGFNIGVARKFGNLYTLGFLARALESSVGTNILSTPNLVTLDNEEAKIVVGQNVPFVTGQYTNTGTATTSPFQTIERKDVGTTLRIRPQIGENGTVRMVIYQESSSVAGTAAVGTSNAGPTTNKRSIESTITVDDGQIIVLGGLIEDTYDSNRSKVPLLGDIPYLGALFRSESRTRKKTNLMVFLRPVVMRDQAASNRMSLDRYDYIRSEQINTQPASNGILGTAPLPVLPAIRPDANPPSQPPRPLGDVEPVLPVLPSQPAPNAAPVPIPAPAPVPAPAVPQS